MRESDWLRVVTAQWGKHWRGGPDGAAQVHHERQEDTTAVGTPDLLTLDARSETVVRLEFKIVTLPRYLKQRSTSLGITKSQAVRLWQWVRLGGRAGILAKTEATARGLRRVNAGEYPWLWIPAQVAPEWVERIVVPNGYLTLPHCVGKGTVPIPSVLYRLPLDGRTVECARPLKTGWWLTYVPFPPLPDAGGENTPEMIREWIAHRREHEPGDPDSFTPTSTAGHDAYLEQTKLSDRRIAERNWQNFPDVQYKKLKRRSETRYRKNKKLLSDERKKAHIVEAFEARQAARATVGR